MRESGRTLRLPAELGSVEQFQAMAREAATACGFEDHLLLRVELATEELLVNVINYAYPEGAPGWIELSCEATENRDLVVTIRDGGQPFNPLETMAPDVDAPVQDRDLGGLGLLLVRKMTDGISYERDGETNLITLRFRGQA